MHTSPRLRSLLEAAGIHCLRLLFHAVPPALAVRAGAALGWLLFHVVRLERRRTLENLATAFGDTLDAAARRRLAARCYRHFGAVIAEFVIQPRLAGRLERHVELENPEVLDAELAAGRGVLVATGHLGNWELMGSAVAAAGYPFSAYVGRQHNPFADAFVNVVRRRMGMQTVPKDSAVRGMVRALRNGRVLTILSDQHYSRERHYVRFFGRPVSVAPGLGTLVRLLQVAVVFAETSRVAPLRYRVRFQRLELPGATGEEELDMLRATQTFFDALEAAVRRHPEQYFWMHRRWRHVRHDLISEVNRAFLAGETDCAGVVEAGATNGAVPSGAARRSRPA